MSTIRIVGPEVLVNTTTAGEQLDPKITALSDGGYVVTWMSQDGSSWGIYAQRYTAAGVATGGEVLVNTTTANVQEYPAITALSDGGYIVTWSSFLQDGSGYGIYAQRYTAAGVATGGEVLVNTTTASDQQNPAITALSDGGYVVTWTSSAQDGSGWGIYAQRYTAAGFATGGEVGVNTTTVSDQRDPSITALSDGGYVVTWMSLNQDGSGYGIYAQRYTAAGVATGGEVLVNTTTADQQLNASITTLSDGGYVVTWMSASLDESGWDVYAQRYTAAGVATGGEVLVNTTTANSQFYPAITALSDGGYVVTWMSWNQDGSGYGIYAQRYTAAGVATGGEVRVNTTTASNQQDPAITALSDGGYVVTWMSYIQDGSVYGIYSRTIGPSGSFTEMTSAIEYVDGTSGADTYLVGADGLNAGDVVDGGAGADVLQLTTPGTFNLTDVTLIDVETIAGSAGMDVLTLNGALWDLRGLTFTGIETLRPTAAQTVVLIDSLTTALLIDASATSVTVDATGLALTSAQHSTLFANGIDAVTIGDTQYFANGSAVSAGSEVLVNTTTASDQFYPAITALSDGGYVVTWMSWNQDGSEWDIYAQRYTAAGVATGGEVLVNTITVNSQQDPAITALSDGGYVVTWTSLSQDGSGYGIYAQRYTAAGVATGGEVLVDTTTANDQFYPAITALSDGGYVVTWMSWNQDGSGYGIYSRTFTGIPANNTPSGTDGIVSATEDTAYVFTTADFGFTDPDSGDELAAVRVDTLPANGELRLNGTAISALDEISTADIAAGLLTYIPASNAYGAAASSFTFSVSDGTDFDTSPNTLTIDITPVNDAPTVANPIGAQSVAEDQAWTFIVPVNAFADIDGDDLTLSATLGNGAPLPAWLSFDPVSRTFAGTPPENFNGDIELIVRASDGEFDVSEPFTLTVTPVNDAPVIRSSPTRSVLENVAGSFALLGSDVEDGDVTFSIVEGVGDGALFTIVGAPGAQSLAFAAQDYEGPKQSFTARVRVTDSGGEVTEQDITVAIENQSDADVDGDSLANTLHGSDEGTGGGSMDAGAGNDLIYARGGDDWMLGGSGNDMLFGGLGADTHDGGAGTDYARYNDAAYGDLVISLIAPATNTGAAAGDTYISIEGIIAGTGNDDITGNGSANLLYGMQGNDVVRGDAGADKLYGGTGNDQLLGGTGNDNLFGDAGDDTLDGGANKDRLTGGAGSDTFVFASASHAGLNATRDVVIDFGDDDTIDLTGIDAFTGSGSAAALGDQAFLTLLGPDANGNAVAFSGPQQLRYYFVGQNTATTADDVTIIEGKTSPGGQTFQFQIELTGIHQLQLSPNGNFLTLDI